MTSDIWLVGELTIAQGKTETFKEQMKILIEMVRLKEPDTLIFEFYFNDDETKCYPFELYKNSKGLVTHIKNVSEIFSKILEVSQLTRLEIFGKATEELKEAVAPLGAKIFKCWSGFTR